MPLPSRTLSYLKILTGERKTKQKTTFFDLPLPSRNILFKDSNRREQSQTKKQHFLICLCRAAISYSKITTGEGKAK